MNFCNKRIDIFSKVSYYGVVEVLDKMRVVQPFEDIDIHESSIVCFLAGGMQSTDWIKEVVDFCGTTGIIFANPYNPDIMDIEKQVKWEFDWLNYYGRCHFIASFYFDKYTKQPMTMYELGRASVLCKEKTVKVTTDTGTDTIFTNFGFPIIITINPESPIKEEVVAQCKFAKLPYEIGRPDIHAKRIYSAYRDIKSRMC